MSVHPSASPTSPQPLRHWCLVALLAVTLVATGCRNRPDEAVPQSAPGIIYERAQTSLKAQDFNNAIRLLEALVARFPFAEEARQARIDLIYAYYRSRETESALDAADTFIRENPTHPRIDYAWYIKGLVEFERSPNILEKFFRVDLDARPPQSALKSFSAFRKVVQDFPKSEYAHDARRRMIHLRNRLADYNIYVARYYIDRGAWVAAAQRSKETIAQYDGAPAVREALEIMAYSYEQLGMRELAEQTREVYALNYEEPMPASLSREVGKKKWWKPWG
ncbi:MAG: outer membrane protein assembly factor BamD [Steroidobacteraceae bacterium]